MLTIVGNLETPNILSHLIREATTEDNQVNKNATRGNRTTKTSTDVMGVTNPRTEIATLTVQPTPTARSSTVTPPKEEKVDPLEKIEWTRSKKTRCKLFLQTPCIPCHVPCVVTCCSRSLLRMTVI